MDSTIAFSAPNASRSGVLPEPVIQKPSLIATFASPAFLLAVAVVYAAVCSFLRFRFEKAVQKKFNFPDRASLARMTHDQAQAIFSTIIQQEFPFMYKTSLQFAIFKTYGIPTISKTIVSAKAFMDPKHAPKRYEDTSIIFSEFSLNPPTSERCIKAIARMNYLHSSYIKAGQISNADLLYTLSVCVTEPIRFMKLYEWRPLNDMEVAAVGTFWRGIGVSMGIEYKGFLSKEIHRDGIEFAEDITAWAKEYEIENMRPSEITIKPSRTLVNMMVSQFPSFMRPFASEIVTVLTGDRLREAFMYPEPSIVASFIAYGALVARKFVMRYLTLPRLVPVVYCEEDSKTGRLQHNDYLVEPWYMKPTIWNRWGPISLLTRAVGGKVPGGDSEQYMPEGFVFDDIGPVYRMGKGKDITTEWEDRLKRERTGGCPFAH